MSRMARDGRLKVAPRLAHEKIADPPRYKARLGAHANQRLYAGPKGFLHGLDPDNAPLRGSMVDPVRNAAQRRQFSWPHVKSLRQLAQPGADPGRLPFGKEFCVDEFCASRNRQHGVMRRGPNPQYKASRGSASFDLDPIGLAPLRNVEIGDVGTAGRIFP